MYYYIDRLGHNYINQRNAGAYINYRFRSNYCYSDYYIRKKLQRKMNIWLEAANHHYRKN